MGSHREGPKAPGSSPAHRPLGKGLGPGGMARVTQGCPAGRVPGTSCLLHPVSVLSVCPRWVWPGPAPCCLLHTLSAAQSPRAGWREKGRSSRTTGCLRDGAGGAVPPPSHHHGIPTCRSGAAPPPLLSGLMPSQAAGCPPALPPPFVQWPRVFSSGNPVSAVPAWGFPPCPHLVTAYVSLGFTCVGCARTGPGMPFLPLPCFSVSPPDHQAVLGLPALPAGPPGSHGPRV